MDSVLTHFAFPGKRGNCIFAIIPPSIKFVENEGEAGASLDHGNPKKKIKTKQKQKQNNFRQVC